MPDTDIEFQNEKEWRRYQIKRLDALESKMDDKLSKIEYRMTSLEILGATLKVKVGMISAFFGAISGSVMALLKH
jgi:hypothetical protein